MIVFDITRTIANGSEQNIFTAIKTEADNFVFSSMFMNEVQFTYKKIEMPDEEFERELKARKQAEDQKQLSLL